MGADNYTIILINLHLLFVTEGFGIGCTLCMVERRQYQRLRLVYSYSGSAGKQTVIQINNNATSIFSVQVYLMSRSWDNVASMHDHVFNNSTCSQT